MSHPVVLVSLIATFAAGVGYLAGPRSTLHFMKVFLVSGAALATLMGLGAVFGKVLGDFLRGGGG